MSPKFITFALSKAQILEFLGLAKSTKIAKKQLVEQLLQHIEMDFYEKERFLATFLYELAVEPVEIEELLQCTPVERRRWVKEGKLPVLEYRTFRKSGRDLEYPVHDRREILKISQAEIQQWRETHQTEVQAHRKAGAQAATERRRANRQLRHHFLLSWQQTIDEWKQKGSAELVLLLVLAYWTLWASRWAKENILESFKFFFTRPSTGKTSDRQVLLSSPAVKRSLVAASIHAAPFLPRTRRLLSAFRESQR